jgi:KaiC/GvpD/RAD55 family RecA-like ATPase
MLTSDDAFAPLARPNGALVPNERPLVPVVPIPADAPRMQSDFGRELGRPIARWTYHDRAGCVAFYVLRFEPTPGSKTIRPYSLWRTPGSDSVGDWRQAALPAPRPLYRLPELSADTSRTVLVVEGEKAADAAAGMFPEFCVTTSSGGSNAATKTDWSPLRGRKVAVWPDNDPAGDRYARDVAALCRDVGTQSVAIVDLTDISVEAETFPAGWDLADPLPKGWNRGDLLARINHAPKLAADDHRASEDPIAKGFKLELYRDLDANPIKRWLVDDLFGAGELSVIFGAPGCGKSVLVTDLACHVAAGLPWMGKRTRAGAVLYVAAERAGVVCRRLAAWRKAHAIEDIPVGIIDGVFDLASPGAPHVDGIVSSARELERLTGATIGAVVIDTAAQVLAGQDENSFTAMGAFVASLARLQNALQAHVCVVHHVPHYDPERMRGHGALPGAADTTILVRNEGGTRSIEVKKASDGPDDLCIQFSLESVTLGHDPETGQETSAPIVAAANDEFVPLDKHAQKRSRLSNSERIAMDALSEAIIVGGREWPGHAQIPAGARCVDEDQWREQAIKSGISPKGTPESMRKAFDRARSSLIAKRKVGFWEGVAWQA